MTTILLQSARASRQNVFDTELLAAMEFLPSEDVTRPGTLTVYDNEGNMHVVANDENFGPPSYDDDLTVDENFLPPDDTDQLDETSSVVADDENFGPPTDGINSDVADDKDIGPTEGINADVADDENFLPPATDGIYSDVANDENFLPETEEIKYFQIHSLYEVDGTQVCLQPNSKRQGSTIVVKPCIGDSSSTLQWWTVDNLGQFRNKKNMHLCMTQAPESKLKLKPCLEPESRSRSKSATSFFIYNYFTNQIHYTRNPRRIVTVPNNLEESNIVLLVKPSAANSRLSGLVENKVNKWAINYL